MRVSYESPESSPYSRRTHRTIKGCLAREDRFRGMREIDRIRRRPLAEQAPGPGGRPYRGVTQAPAKPSTAITHVR